MKTSHAVLWCLLAISILPGHSQGAAVGSGSPPLRITVTSTNDGGAGSLRQALLDIGSEGTIGFTNTLKGRSIVLTKGELTITKNVTISGLGATNLTISGRGASRVFYLGSGVTSSLTDLTISSGNGQGADSPGSGGGIYQNGVMLTIRNVVLTGNTATTGDGGGIYNRRGTLRIENSKLASNSANTGKGGGIYNHAEGALSLMASTVTGNSAQDGGGIDNESNGIFNSPGVPLEIQGSLLAGNAASRTGGGIYTFGTLNVKESMVSGNSAPDGGGLYNEGATFGTIDREGTLRIQNSTFSGNSVTEDGGGIYNVGILSLNNSTLSGNSGRNGAGVYNQYGGFAFSDASGDLTLLNSTIASNSATGNGGVYNKGGVTRMSHTLLAKGSKGLNYVNVSGSARSQGYNLSDDGSCSAFFGPSDWVVTNAKLGRLANYGGPTPTHAPLSGSPAIDAGTTNAIAGLRFDQRGAGFDRLIGKRMDIGAIEVQQAPRFTRIELLSSGPFLSIRALPSETVQIEWKPALNAGSWTLLVRGAADDTGLFTTTDPGGRGQAKRFYRSIRP